MKYVFFLVFVVLTVRWIARRRIQARLQEESAKRERAAHQADFEALNPHLRRRESKD